MQIAIAPNYTYTYIAYNPFIILSHVNAARARLLVRIYAGSNMHKCLLKLFAYTLRAGALSATLSQDARSRWMARFNLFRPGGIGGWGSERASEHIALSDGCVFGVPASTQLCKCVRVSETCAEHTRAYKRTNLQARTSDAGGFTSSVVPCSLAGNLCSVGFLVRISAQYRRNIAHATNDSTLNKTHTNMNCVCPNKTDLRTRLHGATSGFVSCVNMCENAMRAKIV